MDKQGNMQLTHDYLLTKQLYWYLSGIMVLLVILIAVVASMSHTAKNLFTHMRTGITKILSVGGGALGSVLGKNAFTAQNLSSNHSLNATVPTAGYGTAGATPSTMARNTQQGFAWPSNHNFVGGGQKDGNCCNGNDSDLDRVYTASYTGTSDNSMPSTNSSDAKALCAFFAGMNGDCDGTSSTTTTTTTSPSSTSTLTSIGQSTPITGNATNAFTNF